MQGSAMAEELGYAAEDLDKNIPLMESNQHEGGVRCFVCDMAVAGRYYSLATCRAQCSKVRLIEKLGTLVGDQYMVVISEDDIICRDCASNMNTLDRLETEALSIRSNVLKFLEKKYALTEGELVNQKNTGLGQTPCVVPSSKAAQPQNKEKKSSSAIGSNFMARKRRAALAELASENAMDPLLEGGDGDKPLNSQWLQCGTCKYTTTYDSFKRHHLVAASPAVAANILRDKNGIEDLLDNGPSTSKKRGRKVSQLAEQPSAFIKQPQFADEISQDGSHNEEMSIIGAELGPFSVDNDFSANVDAEETETIKVQIVSHGQRKTYTDENDVTIELSDKYDEAALSNAEIITNDCVLEAAGQDMLKMAGPDGNTVYVQMIGKDKGSVREDSLRKQLLTVNEDGTVEMVEVLWDENEMREGAEDDGESPFQ